MKTLSTKNLFYFLISTLVILVCCFPLFYKIMIYFYAEDLDELVEYRKDEFLANKGAVIQEADILLWNEYHFDQKIIPYDSTIPLNNIVQEQFFSPSDNDRVAYRTLYVPIKIEGRDYMLMTRTAMIESDDLKDMILCQYGLLILILIISLSIIQWWISKRLWSPFYKVLDKIKQFNLEKGRMPDFEPTDTVEFVQLTQNLEMLIHNNLSIYHQQKEFIENASHELQTPLALLRSQLDMLLQDPNLTEAQIPIIQSLYDTTLRLTRLNKNLLLLAKIENNHFKDFELIVLGEILNRQLDMFQDRFEDKRLTLTKAIDASWSIHANRVLTESLINNLVVNAIRYTDKGQEFKITLSKSKLLIENSGDMALHDEVVFTRFNHVVSSTNRENSGTGLGLSIVKQICQLHGWSIKYAFINQMHCFEIVF